MYPGTIINVTCRSYLISIFVDRMARWLRPKNRPSETCDWNMTKCRDEIIIECWPCHFINIWGVAITYKGRDKLLQPTVYVGCNYTSLPLISAYGTTLICKLNDRRLIDICLGLYWCSIRSLILVIFHDADRSNRFIYPDTVLDSLSA